MRHRLITATIATAFMFAVGKTIPVGAGQRPAGTGANNKVVVFAIDTSGSTARHLRDVTESLSGLLDGIALGIFSDDDSWAVVNFDDGVRDSGTPTTHREYIKTRLRELRPAGARTELVEGLFRSLDVLLRDTQRSVRRVIVVSNGWEGRSDRDVLLFVKQALTQRVAVHSVWIGQPVGSTRDLLRLVSERTGGTHTDISDPQRIGSGLLDAFEKALAPAR